MEDTLIRSYAPVCDSADACTSLNKTALKQESVHLFLDNNNKNHI